MSKFDMAKAANGKAMRARRKKRYERLDPIYERRRELTNAIQESSIQIQSGAKPEVDPPNPNQWSKETRQTPEPEVPHTREDIDQDVEKLKAQLLPY